MNGEWYKSKHMWPCFTPYSVSNTFVEGRECGGQGNLRSPSSPSRVHYIQPVQAPNPSLITNQAKETQGRRVVTLDIRNLRGGAKGVTPAPEGWKGYSGGRTQPGNRSYGFFLQEGHWSEVGETPLLG